jgi:hypothetical protein
MEGVEMEGVEMEGVEIKGMEMKGVEMSCSVLWTKAQCSIRFRLSSICAL